MNTVTMKNVEFGAGVPKICVPICGKTKEDAKGEIVRGIANGIFA